MQQSKHQSIQKKYTSVQEALACAEVAMNHMKRMMTDDSFRQFYGSTVEEAKELTGDPVLPRYRCLLKKLDEGKKPHTFKVPEEMFRMHYLYAIEEISDRFDQKSLQLPTEIETLLLTACNNQDMSQNLVPECVAEIYHVDLDVRMLEIQLQMLPDLLQAFKKSKNLQNIIVTKPSSVSEILAVVPMAKEMFSEVYKLLRLFLTIPVTTCTAERSFSALMQMKTYLSSTMTEERLNNVMLLHVHKDEMDALDLRGIAKSFVSTNTRRMDFFGKL